MKKEELISYLKKTIDIEALSDYLNAYTDTIRFIDAERVQQGVKLTLAFDWMDSDTDDCRSSTVEPIVIHQGRDGIWREGPDVILSGREPILFGSHDVQWITKAMAKEEEKKAVTTEAFERAAMWRDLGAKTRN